MAVLGARSISPRRIPWRAAALLVTLLSAAPVRLSAAEPTAADAVACGCQDTGRNKAGGIASAVMGLAGFILVVRRFRQRSRLPRDDQKFGDYRGPKKD